MTPGYSALQSGAAILDLSSRGRIRVTGEDRARLLHAMSTNHVQEMKPGQGRYVFFLDAQGRIQADACLLCFEDHFLIDTEPETRQSLLAHLDRYIIADDAALEDVTDQTFCLGLEGPKAREIAEAAALPSPGEPFAHVDWGSYTLSAISATGAPAVRIHGLAERRDELMQTLEAVGAIAASPEDAEPFRLRNFKPRYGTDFTERTLPQETGLTEAMHYRKGCYLGQEIVERVRSRGHVNRQLMGFRLEGGPAPEKNTKLIAGGKEAGEVTSAAQTPVGEVFGIALVRVPYNQPGTAVGIEGRPALLTPRPAAP